MDCMHAFELSNGVFQAKEDFGYRRDAAFFVSTLWPSTSIGFWLMAVELTLYIHA